jgi:hypothetical protein
MAEGFNFCTRHDIGISHCDPGLDAKVELQIASTPRWSTVARRCRPAPAAHSSGRQETPGKT